MTDQPTPGQIAYVVWWRTRYGMQHADETSTYQMLPATDRRAWEAAAQGVRDAYKGELAAAWHQGQEEERSRE